MFFPAEAPSWIAALVAALLAGGATAGLIALMLRRAQSLPLDHPNERSLHTRPTPRIGGLALFPGVLLAALVVGPGAPDAGLLLALAACLFVLSAHDDRRGLPVTLRLGSHLVAALWLAFALLGASVAAFAAAFLVAWMTNLYNFMDGSNGLAGGMALFGFAAFGLAGAPPVLGFALAGAAAGFLIFNFEPARIFMGDAGSIPLGFLAGGVGLAGAVRGIWPVWFPLLVFSPFVVDASLTLLRRLHRREKIWQAHRDHYYQRLIRMGSTHRQLALMAYALMAACALSALGLLRADAAMQAFGLVAWTGIYLMLAWHIDRRWHTHMEGTTA